MRPAQLYWCCISVENRCRLLSMICPGRGWDLRAGLVVEALMGVIVIKVIPGFLVISALKEASAFDIFLALNGTFNAMINDFLFFLFCSMCPEKGCKLETRTRELLGQEPNGKQRNTNILYH